MTEPAARAWYVLLHTRGPAVPDGETVGDQPGISEHFAFLARRAEAGQLVAAGPMGDSLDNGMTVLEVDSFDEAERLAREDDQAVASGVLAVEVRPWHVRMSRL